MRIPMKRLVAVGAASMVFLAACGGKAGEGPGGEQGASDEPATGGTVHMLQNSDFSYLDPARGFDGGVNAFYRLVYRGLTMQTAGDADDPNEIVPDLATGLGEVSTLR